MKVYNQEFDDALVKEYQEHVVNGTTYKIVSSKRFRPVIKAVKALAEDYLSNYTNLPDERVKKIIKFAVVALVTHDIWGIEDVKTKIPKCQYCDSGKLVVPDASGSKNRGKFTRHCGRKECSIKYTADRTKEAVKEKYGVENISSLESMKKLKSKKLKDAYARKGKEINEKRKKTVREKYGVDNISQLNEVKAKKGQTFTEHYGVDNIFKRSDLMKQFWKKKLGVENPSLLDDVVREHIHHFNTKEYVNIHGTKIITLNDFEKDLLLFFNENLPDYVFGDIITANDKNFVLHTPTGEQGYVADVFVKPDMVIELKYFPNSIPNLNGRDGKFLDLIKEYGTQYVVYFCVFLNEGYFLVKNEGIDLLKIGVEDKIDINNSKFINKLKAAMSNRLPNIKFKIQPMNSHPFVYLTSAVKRRIK